MIHSRSAKDVRDDMRTCIILEQKTTAEGRKGLRQQYKDLERELSDKERELVELKELYD